VTQVGRLYGSVLHSSREPGDSTNKILSLLLLHAVHKARPEKKKNYQTCEHVSLHKTPQAINTLKLNSIAKLNFINIFVGWK